MDEKTAELIARLDEAIKANGRGPWSSLCSEARATLAAQAQEIELASARAEAAEARVRELEASTLHTETVQAMIDKLEAATIERCAALLDKRNYRELRSRSGMGQILAATQDQEAKDCAAAVRALKEPAQELSPPRS